MAPPLRPVRALVCGLALAASLVCAASAHAATPIQTPAATPIQLATETSNGVAPVVDVDSAGNADITWSPDGTSVSFCRLLKGATSCSATITPTLPPGTTDVDALNVFATSATGVEIFATAKCGTTTGADGGVVRWASTNGGASFGTGTCKVTLDGPLTNGKGFLDASDRFLGADAHTGGGIIFRALASGTSSTSKDQIGIASVDAGGLYTDGAAVGEGGGALVTAVTSQSDGQKGIRVAEFTGNISNGAVVTDSSLNTAANWSKAATVAGSQTAEGEVPYVLSPAGTAEPYVAGLIGYGSDLSEIELVGTTRSPGPTLGAPSTFTGGFGDGKMEDLAATADASGLQFTWFDDGTRLLRYGKAPVDATGAPTGPITLQGTIANVDSTSYSQPDLATAPDGSGVDVWLGTGGQVMAVPLKASADVLPADTPTPAPVSTPTQPGGSKAPSVPTVTPTPITAPGTPSITKTATSSVDGGSVELSVPTACQAPGSGLQVTVFFASKVTTKKGGGTKVVGVKKVAFFVGSKLVVTDTKAPFKQTLHLGKSAKAGSTVTIKAKAYTKTGKGVGPTKTLTEKVTVCG